MNEELICENNISCYKYSYYLIESVCDIDALGKVIRYGIKINCYDNSNRIVESKCVKDVFGNKNKMIKGIEILKRLEVTPVTLEDVIIDNIY